MQDSSSLFREVDLVALKDNYRLYAEFQKDSDPRKVNLSVGAYRTDEDKPWILPVVRKVEEKRSNDRTINHEYLEIEGLLPFTEAATRLILGENSPSILQKKACGIQTIGGTGAIRIAAAFLKKFYPISTVYIPSPSWMDHEMIFEDLSFKEVRHYRYLCEETKSLDFQGLIEDLRSAKERSVVIFQACAHNPTGVDPTPEQWIQIASIVKERQLFPVFDAAYLGIATGDIDKDAFAVRHFDNEGFEMFVAQSFSKNFGLYGERVGNLVIRTGDSDSKMRVKSQMEVIVRTLWSSPTKCGAEIVTTVLNDPSLYSEWKENVKTMADRIKQVRQLIWEKLKANGTPGNWSHFVQQIGFFTYSGLNSQQVEYILENYHIYFSIDGRINMGAVTTANVDYIADAILDAVTKVKKDQ